MVEKAGEDPVRNTRTHTSEHAHWHITHNTTTQRDRERQRSRWICSKQNCCTFFSSLRFHPLTLPFLLPRFSLTIHNPHVASFTWNTRAPCSRSLSESFFVYNLYLSLFLREGERGFHCRCCRRSWGRRRMESTESSYVSSPEGPRKHAASPPPKSPSLGIW